MNWVIFAAAGQLLLAFVAILDKYIVTDTKVLPRPFVYAFYSCVMTGGWMVIYALGFIPGAASLGVPTLASIQAPTIEVVGMSFLAAYTLFMALVSMYEALRQADASDVMPVIGAVSALITFSLSFVLLGEALSSNFVYGTILLIVGTMLVSQFRFTKSITLYTIHAGLFFGLHYLAMKGLFTETSFDDGFFWSRLSFILFALSLLLVPSYLAKITAQTKKTTARSGMLVVGTKILSGVGAFLLLKATDAGDVAVVQALDGLKFVFIVLISLAIGRFLPKAAGENEYTNRTLLRKVLFISVIAIGFVLLFR